MLLTKSIVKSSLKDVDSKEGIVTFAWAHFGSVDLDNDIIQEGAYTKSLKERGDKIDHLYNHTKGTPVGKIIETFKDGDYMVSRSRLSKSTKGRDVLALYEEGLIKGHSHGMYLEKYDYQGENRIIKEARLFEVSSLTVEPANPNTPLLNLKSLQGEVEKALKIGNLSDEFYKQLEDFHQSLTKGNHSEPSTAHSEPELDDVVKEKIDEYVNLFNNIKIH